MIFRKPQIRKATTSAVHVQDKQTMPLTDTVDFFFLPAVFLKCPCLSFSFARRTAKKTS